MAVDYTRKLAKNREWKHRNKARAKQIYNQWVAKHPYRRAKSTDRYELSEKRRLNKADWNRRNQERVQAGRIRLLTPDKPLWKAFASIDAKPERVEDTMISEILDPFEALCQKEEQERNPI